MYRILYLDLLCPRGHVNFNNIYLNYFSKKSNVIVDVAMPTFYLKQLDFTDCKNMNIIQLPDALYTRSHKKFIGSIINRLHLIRLQWYLKNSINLGEYDQIFISSFDNISSLFLFFPRNTFLVCHNNLTFVFSNIIHKYSLKIIANRYKLGVFTNEMLDYCLKNNINRLLKIPHGLPKPIMFDKPIENLINSRLIFIPSSYSLDRDIINKILSKEFNDFLKKHNFSIALKWDSECIYSNINLYTKYLSKDEYNNLFIKSYAILIPYDKSFKLRTSGVLMEAIANNKKIILRDIPAFSSFKANTNVSGVLFFNSFDDLKSIISCRLLEIQPDYSPLINGLFPSDLIESMINA